MGKRKIEMQLIEDKQKRMVAFSKRKLSLFKKAKLMSRDFNCDVAITLFSGAGKRFAYGDNELLIRKFLNRSSSSTATQKIRGENPYIQELLLLKKLQRIIRAEIAARLNQTYASPPPPPHFHGSWSPEPHQLLEATPCFNAVESDTGLCSPATTTGDVGNFFPSTGDFVGDSLPGSSHSFNAPPHFHCSSSPEPHQLLEASPCFNAVELDTGFCSPATATGDVGNFFPSTGDFVGDSLHGSSHSFNQMYAPPPPPSHSSSSPQPHQFLMEAGPCFNAEELDTGDFGDFFPPGAGDFAGDFLPGCSHSIFSPSAWDFSNI